MTTWADPVVTWADSVATWEVEFGGSGIAVDPTLNLLTTHRGEAWHWDLLDGNDNTIGRLDGVADGSLEFSIFNTIRGGGSFTYTGTSVLDWINLRVQPWYTATFVDGTVLSMPLGLFLCSAPTQRHTETGIDIEVELYDKLLVLDQNKIEEGYSLATGTVVTDTVRTLVTATPGAGSRIAIADSVATLAAPMVWKAGTTTLSIVNDLLAAINYFSLWVDGYGVFRADPYIAPAYRPVAWTFWDDDESIYSPDFQFDFDDFETPNKVILIGRSPDGDTEGLTSVAENTNPSSRTSFPSRGRWITLVEEGVEAVSQTVLDGLAARKLADGAETSAIITMSHALIPLNLNDVVAFRRLPGDIDIKAVVQSMGISTSAGSLVTTKIRQVLA